MLLQVHLCEAGGGGFGERENLGMIALWNFKLKNVALNVSM